MGTLSMRYFVCRRRITTVAMVLLLAVVAGNFAFAQIETKAEPTFFVETVSYASAEKPGNARVDLYVQVPYEELRFIKENEKFVARYDVTLSFYNEKGQIQQERTWTEVVSVSDFAQTTSPRFYSLAHRSMEIAPGTYQANIQIFDQDSRKTARRRRNLLVTDFAKDSLSMSDIMLVSRLSTSGEKRSIIPNISGNVGHLTDGFFLFFELYSKGSVDSVSLTWKIFDSSQKEIRSQSQEEALSGNTTQAFMKVDRPNLAAGTYLLTIDAVPVHPSLEKPDLSAKTSRTFTVRWSDLPPTVEDLDKATDQMRYVARESEMEYIREAPDAETKRQRFLEFWKKRDPDPGSEMNEVMDEYYARVAFCNRSFQHYIEGWRTDRGMVYIYLGPPDNIERYPFQNNAKPYEIWYYNQLNRQYVFVDESGFGDYRLRTPASDLWDRVR